MSLEPDKSAFLEFLDFIGRPGQVVKNTLGGRGESALRHVGQFGLDAVDGFLPGDWLPNDVARPEDDMSGRELIGADDDFLGNVAGFGVDMLTDPLTYVPGAVIAKGAKGIGGLAKAGASKAVGPEAVEAGLRHVRSTFGATKLPDHLRKVVDGARGGKLDKDAVLRATAKALGGFDNRQLDIIGDGADNFKWQDGKLVGELVDTSVDPVVGKRFGSLRDRILAHPDLVPGEADRLIEAAGALTGIGRSMRGRKHIFDPADQANLSDEYLARLYSGLPENDLLERTAGATKPTNERSLEGYREVQGFLAKPGNEAVRYERNALKRMMARGDSQGELSKRADIGQGIMGLLRSGGLNLPEELIEDSARGIANAHGPVPASGAYADVGRMLGGEATDGPGISGLVGDMSGTSLPPVTPTIDDSISDIYGIGNQSGKAVVGESTAKTFSKPSAEQMSKGREKLLADDFAYSNTDHKKIVNAAIVELGKTDKESAKLLHDAFNGMPARGWLTSLMAKSNSVFKPHATAGYILPKLGFSVRNRLSGAWSVASNKETRGVAIKGAKRALVDVAAAIAEGMGFKSGDRLGKVITAWDDALSNSGGSAERALEILEQAGHKDAAAFIRAGGLPGFIKSEVLENELTSNGTAAKLHRMAKWPAKIAKGVEDRMRLGHGLDLMDAGKNGDEAARLANETLFDYDISSASNRTFRDFVPFGQFMAKAVPQQAKFLAEQPRVAAGIGHALDQDDDAPTPPWMDGRIAVPLGDHQYLSGFGLPFEALNQIPNPSASLASFGRDIKKQIIGSSQPVAKTAWSAVAGEDPFFESPFGSYDRMPIVGKAGEAGRMYNIATGTGLTAAADAPLRTIDKMFDDRKSPLLRAADFLTGANVTTVDPDMAIQQRLTQALKNNPDIRQIRTPINTGDSEELDQMLQSLRDVKARLKAKRDQEKAKAGAGVL